MTPCPKPAKRPKAQPRRITRRVRPRPRAAGDRAKAMREAASLWSRIVRAKAGNDCEAACFEWECNRPAHDAAHVFGKKAHPRIRYLLLNGISLCRQDHDFYTRHPTQWEALSKEVLGHDYAKLVDLKRTAPRLDPHAELGIA